MRTPIMMVTAAALALTATAASAGTWGASHPRRHEVNSRLENQNDRINAGVRDGQLTHAEAHSLRSDDRALRTEERTMARNDGGHITKADQRALNQQENANSRAIYADRHN